MSLKLNMEMYMRMCHAINARCVREMSGLVACATKDKLALLDKFARTCGRKQRPRHNRMEQSTVVFMKRMHKSMRERNKLNTRRQFARDLRNILNDVLVRL